MKYRTRFHNVEQIQRELPLEISRQDGAVIGTIRCQIPGAYDAALEQLKTAISRTAEDVEAAGGLIGHCKAFARHTSLTAMLSLPETGALHIDEGSEPMLMVESVSIVFGIGPEKLEEILQTHYAAFLKTGS